MRGEFQATVLQEPYITAAAKLGCRIVSTTFFHGTWVADPNLVPEVHAAFLRTSTRAVERVNATSASTCTITWTIGRVIPRWRR